MSTFFIDNQEEFDSAILELEKSSKIGIDTEFIRRTTYYALPCLLQLSTDKNIYLVDLLKNINLAKFGLILSNKNILKILHAGGEDFKILSEITKSKLVNFFDTQIGASFANIDTQIGYLKLVQHIGEKATTNKELSLSDWKKRPLTQELLTYAAFDVTYLIKIYEYLLEMVSAEILSYIMSDTENLITKKNIDSHTKFHQSSGLKEKQQLFIAQILLWREEEAKKNNIVKRYIVDDKQIPTLAQSYHEITRTSIQNILMPQQYYKYGFKILDFIEKYKKNTKLLTNTKIEPILPVLSKEKKIHLANMLSLVKEQAKKINISASILASKKNIIDLMYYTSYQNINITILPLPILISGWRKDILGTKLLNYCCKNL